MQTGDDGLCPVGDDAAGDERSARRQARRQGRGQVHDGLGQDVDHDQVGGWELKIRGSYRPQLDADEGLHAVESHVLTGDLHRQRVGVEGQNRRGSQPGGSNGQNPRTGPHVEHRRAGVKVVFQRLQAETGGGV